MELTKDFLNQLYVAASDAMSLVDVSGVFQSCNPAAVALFKAKAESELLGQSLFEFTQADDHPVLTHALEQARQNATIQPFQCRLKATDGTVFLSDVSGSVIYHVQEKKDLLFLTMKNIPYSEATESHLFEAPKSQQEIRFMGLADQLLTKQYGLKGEDELITDICRFISTAAEAILVGFSRFDGDKKVLQTKYIEGEGGIIKLINKILQSSPEKFIIPVSPEFEDRLRKNQVEEFFSLSEITNGMISEPLSSLVMQSAKIGHIYGLVIKFGDRLLGTMVILSEEAKPLVNLAMMEQVSTVIGTMFLQNQLANSVQESKKRYDEMFDRSQSGIVVYRVLDHGEDFEIVAFNKGAEAIENVRREDVLGKKVTEAFPGVAEFGLLAAMKEVYEKRQPIDLPMTFYHDDRLEGWRENRIYPISKDEIVAVYEDKTEEKRTLAALEENERYLKGINRFITEILNAIEDPVFVKNEAHEWVMLNDSFCRFMGYPRNQLIGKTDRDFFPQEEADVFWEKDHKVFKSGKVDINEERFTNSSGETRIISTIKSVFKSENGSKILVGTIRDVTKDRLAEQEVRKAFKTVGKMLEAMPVGVTIIGLDRKIRHVNQKALSMLGLTQGEVIGRTCTECFCDNDECPAIKNGANNIENEECFLHLKDGSKLPIYKTVVHIELDGEHLLMEAFVDVSEKKRQAEREKEYQSQMLAQAKLATLGEVATGIAHEINQPLTFISTLFQIVNHMVQTNQIEVKDPDVRNMIKQGSGQVNRITEIIQHMRTFGRKEGVEKQAVSIEETINNALLLLRERIRLKEIELTLDISENLGAAWGNANQLEQVLINLLQNAVDALEPAKNPRKISVSASMKDQNWIEIIVADNGTGMNAQVQEKLFEPFFTTKEVGKGTGLGLSITYGIINEHGGSISFQSEENKGTAFSVLLMVAS